MTELFVDIEAPAVPEEVEFTEFTHTTLGICVERLQNSREPERVGQPRDGSDLLYKTGYFTGMEVEEAFDIQAAKRILSLLTTNMHPRLEPIFTMGYVDGVKGKEVKE